MSKLFSLGLVSLILILNACFTQNNLDSTLMNEESLLISSESKEFFYVYGHKNPDLDSYGSSFAYANLLTKLGMKAKAFALGPPNLETKFVLEYLGEKPLPILTKVPKEAKIILLDHNEIQQSLDAEPNQILQIIDHHKLDLKTPDTISVEIEKVGSTATLIYRRYASKKIKPNQLEASFMLAAILSDTRVLTSPTTTSLDKEACKDLSQITQIDYKKFGHEILLAGTKFENLSAEELYKSDLKHFVFGETKGSIGVVNTTDIPKVLEKREELEAYMQIYKKENKLDFCSLVITDLLKNNSYAIVIGETKIFDKAFGKQKVGRDYDLKSIVSRKRQIIPKLEEAL